MGDERILIGKTIKEIYVDGFEVDITFTDGYHFTYGASDGGYSSYSIESEETE